MLRDNGRINAFISEVIPDKEFFKRDSNYKFSGQIKILSKTGRQLKTYKFENGQEVDFYKNATSTLRIANDEYGDSYILDEIVVQGTYNDYDDYYVGIGYTDWDDYYDNEWDDSWGSPGYAIDQYYEDEYYYSWGDSGSDNIVEDTKELREFELGYREMMTTAEIAIYDKMSRINQVSYLLNAMIATNEAKKLYSHLSQHNDKADAFRHAYFSLLNAIDLGISLAKSLGDAHEDFVGNPALEKEMDLYNNLKGREALSALVQSSDDPSSLIQNLADNGDLKIIKSGSLVKSNQ